jgi:hypothetical protein
MFLTSALTGGEWLVLPPEKEPRYPLDRRLGGPQSRSGRRGKEKILGSTETRNATSSVVQPVASRYTDWAIPAPTPVPIYQTTPRQISEHRICNFTILFMIYRVLHDKLIVIQPVKMFNKILRNSNVQCYDGFAVSFLRLSVDCLAYFSTLKTEVVHSSETSMNYYQTNLSMAVRPLGP